MKYVELFNEKRLRVGKKTRGVDYNHMEEGFDERNMEYKQKIEEN